MAEADNKTTTARFLTLPQAAARIGREELEDALIDGRLLATDRANRVYFEELANFRAEFAQRGVPRADLDAVREISRGFAIPPQSWRRWFWDGVVNFETGEIIRHFEGYRHAVILRPVLRSEDVPVQTTANQTVAVAGESSLVPTGAGAWLKVEAKRMKAAGEISARIRITDFAKLLEQQMRKAATSDGFVSMAGTNKPVRTVRWRTIKNKLPLWGLWPISSI